MINLYTWSTPNGRKVSIMLEELGIEYRVHPINIMKDEQFAPEFLEISPNNKIPAIEDEQTGIKMMESGAILMYLAEKIGRLIPRDTEGRWRCIQWLMLQMGGVGPMLGQTHHFSHFNPNASDYARSRYENETQRLYAVLDQRLAKARYLAGEYSIADIATWPWISRFEWQQVDLQQFPNVLRWYREIADREAVQAGYHVPSMVDDIPQP